MCSERGQLLEQLIMLKTYFFERQQTILKDEKIELIKKSIGEQRKWEAEMEVKVEAYTEQLA